MDDELTRFRVFKIRRDGEEYLVNIPEPDGADPDELSQQALDYFRIAMRARQAADTDWWLESFEKTGYFKFLEHAVWRLARGMIVLAGDDGSDPMPEDIDRGHIRGLAAVRRVVRKAIKEDISTPETRRQFAEFVGTNITAWTARRVEEVLADRGQTPLDIPKEAYDQLFRAVWGEKRSFTDALDECFWLFAQSQALAVLEAVTRNLDSKGSLYQGFERVAREVRERAAKRETRSPPACDPLPASIPQHTFPEAKEVARAIADGWRLRSWSPIEGTVVAMRHAIKGSPLETKVVGGPLLEWFGLPNTIESLQDEIRRLELSAVLLFFVVVGVALEKDRVYVTTAIDDLITYIGMDPRSRKEKDAARQKVWRWLMLFNSLQVVGRRKGKWKDRDTGEMIDITSREDFLHIAGSRMPEQQAFDNSVPPVEVTLSAGPWLDEFRGNRKILTDLGDVRRLAAIPGGRPSGAWARAIGLALHQLWREKASYADVVPVGEARVPTIRFPRAFTRRELLDLFPPNPTYEAILESPNPARAKDYWRDAIKLLQKDRIIGHYRELAPLTAGRKGWDREWLDQQLDIRPASDVKRDVIEIAQRSKSVKKARARKRNTRRTEPA